MLLKVLLLANIAFSAEFSPEAISPAQEAEWVRKQFDDPVAYSIEVDSPRTDYTHSVDLSVVVFKNAGWNNLQLVADHFQKAADIYGRCHIKFGEIKMVVVDAGTNTISQHDTERYARQTPAYFKRPTLYFATQVSDEHPAYAWSGAKVCKEGPFKCNTAWFSSIVNTSRYKGLRSASYSVVAHELAHILGDYDHTHGLPGNILGEFEAGGGNITAEQCKKFKTFSEMTEL